MIEALNTGALTNRTQITRSDICFNTGGVAFNLQDALLAVGHSGGQYYPYNHTFFRFNLTDGSFSPVLAPNPPGYPYQLQSGASYVALAVNPRTGGIYGANGDGKLYELKEATVETERVLGPLNVSTNVRGLSYGPCPLTFQGDTYLQNETVSNTRTYTSYGVISAGSNVTTSLPTGPYVVDTGADVTFWAGQKIKLMPGFSVKGGAKFTALADASLCNL